MFSIAKIRMFLFILAIAPLVRCQDQAVFFYSSEFDACDWLGNSITATNNTENGGLCAYEESTQRVYACPAPDATCWTFGQTCGKGIGAAGPNQIACSNDGDVWCCAGDETCTLDPNQVDVCISNFTSLNAKVQPSAAASAEYAALGVTSVGTVAPTGTPLIISTIILGTSTSSSSSSSFSSFSSQTRPASSATNTASSATNPASSATNTASSTPSASNSGLSGGGIAGIVIGVIAGITIFAAGLFFLLRKRRSTSRTQAAELGPSDRKEELPGDQLVGKYPHQQHQIAEVDSSYRHPVVEADAGYPRQEMS